jgi:thiamine biosynthesis lipoprotein
MEEILNLAEDLKKQTEGYLITRPDGTIDPSGIVKGLAIANASLMLKNSGINIFLSMRAGCGYCGEFVGIKNFLIPKSC